VEETAKRAPTRGDARRAPPFRCSEKGDRKAGSAVFFLSPANFTPTPVVGEQTKPVSSNFFHTQKEAAAPAVTSTPCDGGWYPPSAVNDSHLSTRHETPIGHSTTGKNGATAPA
jgi:hypothetical protein